MFCQMRVHGLVSLGVVDVKENHGLRAWSYKTCTVKCIRLLHNITNDPSGSIKKRGTESTLSITSFALNMCCMIRWKYIRGNVQDGWRFILGICSTDINSSDNLLCLLSSPQPEDGRVFCCCAAGENKALYYFYIWVFEAYKPIISGISLDDFIFVKGTLLLYTAAVSTRAAG